jgi:hypothetical protein
VTFFKKYLQQLDETSLIRDSASEKVEAGQESFGTRREKNEA